MMFLNILTSLELFAQPAAVVGELKNARFVATSCSPAHRQSLRVVCLCIAADNVKSIVEFLFDFTLSLLKSRGPILHVTSSETCSVCVKQALNTCR